MFENISRVRILLFLVLANFLVWAFPFYKFLEKFEPSGDEPHYLIMTQSLIYDQDLDLRNNYLNKDYKDYYQRMELEVNPMIVSNKEWYAIYNIGLPILSIPSFLVANRLGVSLLMFILSVLVMLNIFLLVEELFKSRALAILIWFIFVSSFPMLFYHFQIITEIPAALGVIYAYRLTMTKPKSKYSIFLIALITCFLPWLHMKYIFLSLCLIILSGVTINLRSAIWEGTLFVINLILLFIFCNHYYHDPLYFFKIQNKLFNPLLAWKGLFGLLIDQEFGLLFYAPIFTTLFSGIYLGIKGFYKKPTFGFVIIFGSLWFLCGAYNSWHAGWSFPARYLLPGVPLLAIPLGLCIKNAQNYTRRGLLLGLYLLTLLISVKLLEHPWNLYNTQDGTSNLLMSLENPKLPLFFPSFISAGYGVQNALWVFLVVLINYFFLKFKSNKAVSNESPRSERSDGRDTFPTSLVK